MSNETSYFKNWHKSNLRLKKRGISSSFPCYVRNLSNGGLDITFTDEWGKKIEFILCKEHADLFKEQLSRPIK